MKKILLFWIAVLPLMSFAQDVELDDWRNTDNAKRWVQEQLGRTLSADSATQAALVGAMAPYSDFEVLAALPVPEGVRVACWLDRKVVGSIGLRRFNTTLLIIGDATIDSAQSFSLADAEEVDNAWTPIRKGVAHFNEVDDSLKGVAQGGAAEVYQAFHSYYQNLLGSIATGKIDNALVQLDRLQVSLNECCEFLRLRSQVESAHQTILKDYADGVYAEALPIYKDHYSQCSLSFDPRLGRSDVRRLREMTHLQRCFIQYANSLLLASRKNQQMDSLFSNGLGAEALGEYKAFYLQYNKTFDPADDSASVSRIQELVHLQDDYVRFIELRIRLAENNNILEAHTEKPYAKMMNDYKKYYTLLNRKMTASAAETNTRLQKAIDNQECYKRCISLYEHTLQQHELMTDQVEKVCKDVIKVYKTYYKSNKPVYSGSALVYDKQLNQMAAMQRAFQHMANLRQQIDAKNDAIHELSARWNKPVIKAYESVFDVLNLEVTPDTNGSISYLESTLDMQDSCISYIHRFHKIIENNDIIESQKSKAKHIVKAYQGYYEDVDMEWVAKKDCYIKLVKVARVQEIFLNALQREEVEALDKSIKSMKKPSFETILSTLR